MGAYVNAAEEKKRMTVLTRKPKTVLLRLRNYDKSDFERVERDADSHREALIEECRKRGLDPEAYGNPVDSGYRIANGVKHVFLTSFVDELKKRGLNFVRGYIYEHKPLVGESEMVTVLEFSDMGEAKDIPMALLHEIENLRWDFTTIWANWRYIDPIDESRGQFRLDTISVYAGRAKKSKGFDLETKGNTYVFVDDVSLSQKERDALPEPEVMKMPDGTTNQPEKARTKRVVYTAVKLMAIQEAEKNARTAQK